MKYGVIVFDNKVVNIGDWGQSYAVLKLYEKMGISQSEIVYFNIRELSSYRGEKILLPMCLWFGRRHGYSFFPISEDIVPVFLVHMLSMNSR